MWELRNRTPFLTVQAFDRDEEGREVLCVALRGSFRPGPADLCLLAPDQAPPLLAPTYDGDALLYDADIVPFMPGAEVTVHGYADPVVKTSRLASISLGALTKTVALHPRLKRTAGGHIESHPDAAPLSLDWSQSLGGDDTAGERHPANPIGRGLGARDGLLPRITAATESPAKATTVIGLGPVQRHWEPRLSSAGSYDDAWARDRAPLLPADFNRRYHHAAPPDQCISAPLKGGERLKVEGFVADGDFEVRLPQVVIEIQAEFAAAPETARAQLHRVRVYPDRNRFDLLWLATVPCGGRDHLLRRTTVRLRQSTGISR